MATTPFETGLLLGEFPYLRIGNGPHNLLVIPGTQVDNADPGFIVEKTYRAAYTNFARDHTLYLVNRKRDLPATYTSEDMAADHRMFDAQVRALAPRFRSSCFVANRTGRGRSRIRRSTEPRGTRTVSMSSYPTPAIVRMRIILPS
jgi:hypothetical protein